MVAAATRAWTMPQKIHKTVEVREVRAGVAGILREI